MAYKCARSKMISLRWVRGSLIHDIWVSKPLVTALLVSHATETLTWLLTSRRLSACDHTMPWQPGQRSRCSPLEKRRERNVKQKCLSFSCKWELLGIGLLSVMYVPGRRQKWALRSSRWACREQTASRNLDFRNPVGRVRPPSLHKHKWNTINHTFSIFNHPFSSAQCFFFPSSTPSPPLT